ncbi:hypothetical protein ARGLB_027_00920 [Arthrobacter globiformis NBRC 12137]|jgi:hypothetical protein|uniref:Uncharacterized protein n=1 Tax=Arthrobacter globiformis (strain ATCC 8010 / DSM 20124 / JCM 1332 / NBRC 12137 / NCIMB 8907 / NRRL B-2979 / 168) TaxID=1077972 RepID=H0QIW2_ARTG1|nr:hypothetical protein ARGLB_027_00920 [Arthrobacter globiformis NBRC 12137]
MFAYAKGCGPEIVWTPAGETELDHRFEGAQLGAPSADPHPFPARSGFFQVRRDILELSQPVSNHPNRKEARL